MGLDDDWKDIRPRKGVKASPQAATKAAPSDLDEPPTDKPS